MSRLTPNTSSRKFCLVLILSLVALTVLTGQAHATDVVTTYKDELGWKLQVNGEDFYVKGINWGYTPRNEDFNYNLWGQPADRIRKVLDYDMGLLKAAGVNAIRSFSMIPPEWITYIYKEHGIMTVVNPLVGRYGYEVGGRWVEFTDYSDPLTRATLLADTLELIDRYKTTPGVLMFALGNESNYGLSWSSFEIENLPEGEQNTAKARYLYSLFNEIMQSGKRIAPNHPFAVVNGDIQYIDLIAEICTEMDVLGSNVYRGKSFTGLWAEVQQKLDLPVVFFEFGSDAYNARERKEDEAAQAMILKEQWQEMYNKSYGNGEEGNSIGGFVFEWRDEWWKYLQDENLDIHDTTASWSNQAYMFDYSERRNNMNEEWFGIAALGNVNADGVYEARPRMAYDVLKEMWQVDPYTSQKTAINRGISDMDMEILALKSDVRALKAESEARRKTLSFNGGSVRLESLVQGTEQDIDELGDEGTEFSSGQMVFLDFGFAPTERIQGRSSINILGQVADTEPMILQYGRRGLPVTVLVEREDPFFSEGGDAGGTPTVIVREDFNDRERIEIYDFEASYDGDAFDVNAFYHTPRYHWKYEGDFFGLVRETTDLTSPFTGQDIWNAKAPNGVEFIGDEKLNGMKLLVGDEVYWGANPKAILKYSFNLAGVDYTFMHAEDLARRGESGTATEPTEIQTRQTTLYADIDIGETTRLELGGIMASTEKIGDEYTEAKGSRVKVDDIEFEDTLGFKGKLSFDLLDTRSYLSVQYAGLVADGGDPLKEFGTKLPISGLGNKRVFEAGSQMNFGDFMLFPRFLWRDNLVDAGPSIDSEISDGDVFLGIQPRNRDDDAFAVLDNREATSYELFLTYDPTGATPFYKWDNDVREDASFAFNIGAVYTEQSSDTDSYQFFFEPTGENAAFGVGLPDTDVWEVSSRMVFVPGFDTRLILNLLYGNNQSTGDPEGGKREYYEMDFTFMRGRHVLSGYLWKDAWGPYDFQRQFNLTFPYQVQLDYSILLDELFDQDWSTQIGLKTLFRTFDEDSPEQEYQDGENDWRFLTSLYINFVF